jgi:very-short-patch-repair endonuclease
MAEAVLGPRFGVGKVVLTSARPQLAGCGRRRTRPGQVNQTRPVPGIEVADVLRRMARPARTADLTAICGRAALVRAVDAGTVLRAGRGRYVLPECADPWLAATRLDGAVSHVSAAMHWGLDVVARPVQPHVTVGRNRHDLPPVRATVHWANLGGPDLDARQPVTSPLRTILDCARSLPFGEALAVADSALRRGLVASRELQAAAEDLQGAGRGRVGQVVRNADGRAASGLESGLRAIFIRGRIRGFQPQLVVRDDEFFARVDLGDPVRRIVAEADSFEHHGHRSALVADCRRYNELVVRGWLVLRFAWEHVMFDPDWVESTLRASIGGRHRPGGGQKSPSTGLRRV